MAKARSLQAAWEDLLTLKGQFQDDLFDLLGGDFEGVGHDPYDNSLEILKVEDHVRLSPECQRLIWDAGFRMCYVNHLDGWETHYRWDWQKAEFEASRGWRRRRTDKGFEISHWPEGWTSPQSQEWKTNGYMTIVPDPLETAPSTPMAGTS